ncbi:PREDICTED: alkylated DNA repair protein alkB homolog 8 [Fragaria vesca subsp. vesca]|uniref:alkylated DNA repair protein alkB homolog 8 n=1 Tax=Fragaria vesca subsp. vesca TaxID=101020 RepID=UPI0002C30F9A|nr:PREDICTED: alkylated DNA repair protein alkB homolog 8 [Fragaria vesca subsp. vesca]
MEEILRQVFGDSSDSEDWESEPDPNQRWVQTEGIKGLWMCRDFLSPQNQSALLSTIQNEGWFTEASHNQAMRFGDLPGWAAELSDSIKEVVLSCGSDSHLIDLGSSGGKENVSPFSPELLAREPLFDQLILNSYQPGEGICAHVDLMCFEDGIAILSLESSCVMHFSPVEGTSGDFLVDGEKDPRTTKIPVYLTPGSLILMSGEARYQWKHEINRKPGFQKWQGEELNQKKRISITLRKLCQVE